MLELSSRRATAVVCISEATKKAFLRKFPPARLRTVHVIRNEVPGAEDGESSLLPSARQAFLHMASDAVRKGTATVLSAHALYRKDGGARPLVVIGKYSDAQEAPLVSWLGRVSVERRDALLRSSRGLIFASSCEGFGYPLIEAARAGCLPIGSPTEVFTEVVGSSDWATPPTAAALARAMTRSDHLGDSEYRRQIVSMQHHIAGLNAGRDYGSAWVDVVNTAVESLDT